MNSSFGNSFSQRIKLLCDKYETMTDEEDDLLDLETLKVTTDHGKVQNMEVTKVGSMFARKYIRNRKVEIQKYSYLGFDELYDGLFGNDFDTIYDFINKEM